MVIKTMKYPDGTTKEINMEEMECCGILEVVNDDWPHPISKATMMNFKDGTTSLQWVIRLNKLTKTGQISNAVENNSHIVINFCPFCGENIRQNEENPIDK